MFRRERFSSGIAGGYLSSNSVISGVDNLSLHKPTFNVTFTQNQHLRNDDPQNVLDWLSPINQRIIQNDTFSRHTAGTGTWFIDHPTFQKWFSNVIPVLCAKGPPGIGKTILSSIVIRHLETSFSDNRESIAAIFAYCRYTDRHSVSDTLASFIKQLAERHSTVLSFVESVYRKHLLDGTRPIEQEWLEVLQTLLRSFNRAYIVIDALDEFPDNARDCLLNALVSLQASLLITSRPSNAFSLLRDVEYIEITDENEQDIELFIDQRFKESSNLTSLLREKAQVRMQICAKLKEMSKNMFLVAALQIESLKNSTTIKQLRGAADSLASDIDDIYSASWERIKAQPKEHVLLAEETIMWLTHAYRPLRIIELQHALTRQRDGETFDNDDVADEEMIVSVCCGLIVIDNESKIVRLVHFTALDFFKRLGRNLFSTPHTLMSTRCLSYLSAPRFSTYKISTQEELEDFLRAEEHPLRDYAYHHWGSHAARCYKEDGLPNPVCEFLLEWLHYPFMVGGRNFDLFERCHVAVYYGLRDRLGVSNEWCNRITPLTNATPLILACGQGHVEIVESILSRGANINTQNKDGQTALIMASRNGHDAVVKLLLARIDVAVNIHNKNGWTALSLAAENGHDEVIQLLLSRTDIAVNTEAEQGWTALIRASLNGHGAVVKLLLSHSDVAVNGQSHQGATALIMASQNGQDGVVKMLLSRSDIAVNTQAKEDGRTALIMASQNGHSVVVKLLLSHPDIAVNAQAENGWTALILASQHAQDAVVKLLLSHRDIAVNIQSIQDATALMMASQSGHDAVVRLLLSQTDIAVNTQAENGWTALILASQNGHYETVNLLLSHTDIAINTPAEDGRTALMMASQNGHDAVVKLLLSQPVAVNTQSNDGRTSLILASYYGHDAVVKLLLSVTDITVNTQAGGGWTALMMASQNDHDAVVKLLLSRGDIAVNTEAGDGRTALIFACSNGHGSVVELLLSRSDIALNTPDDQGATALMMASLNGRDRVVGLLLSHSNNIAVNTQAGDGRTALIFASQKGHDAVVKLLLSHPDVDVNAQCHQGATALIMACQNGHDGIVKLLLSQSDIAVNTQTENGWTALFLASLNGHDAAVKLLLSRSDVDLNIQSNWGKTALEMASENGHDAVIELLLSRTDIGISRDDRER